MAFDKLKFWKKSDEFGLGGDEFGADPGLPDSGIPSSSDQDPLSHPDFSQSQQYPGSSPFPGTTQQPRYEQPPEHETTISQRDIELILAKLDMIKSELDSLHQRIRKIEQATEPGQQQKRYW